MLARLCRVGPCAQRLAARGASRAWGRPLSTAGVADGFQQALPGRGVIAPFVALGCYGLGWWVTEDGRIKGLTENFERTMKEMDPEKRDAPIPPPAVMANLVWPIATGLLTSLFESIAARLALSEDMPFLCGPALDSDYMAPTSIALLSFPADHEAFVTALWDKGAVDKVWHILHVYKSVPKEQHDEFLTNACLIAAKAAGSPRGKQLDAGIFAWMITKDFNSPAAPAGIEGLAHLWQAQRLHALKQPVITELDALRTGALPTRTLVGELANRLLVRMAMDTEGFEADAARAREYSLKMFGASPVAESRTLWQSAGISQRETSSALQHRQIQQELATCDAQLQRLREVAAKAGPAPAPTVHERFGVAADVGTAGLVGAVYGYARAAVRAWFKDVTPSTARRLTAHVAARSAAGVMLLIGLQEGVVYLKRHKREEVRGVVERACALVGAAPPPAPEGGEGGEARYSRDALPALVALDMANIAILGVVNFCFPYCILPSLAHPLQFLMPPVEPAFPLPTKK